ncbi:hypothetical protein MCBRY_002736 [Methylocystis bryophila]
MGRQARTTVRFPELASFETAPDRNARLTPRKLGLKPRNTFKESATHAAYGT